MTPSGRTGPRGPYASGLATKEAILAAATEVFARSGETGFGMRDVAKAAGIAHPTVAYHFPSKTDLMRAMFVRFEEILGLFDVMIDENGLLTEPELRVRDLKEVFYTLVRAAEHPRSQIYAMYDCRLHLMAGDPANDFHEIVARRADKMMRFLTSEIAVLQERGYVTAHAHPGSLAMLGVNCWYGVSMAAGYPGTDGFLSQTIRFAVMSMELMGITREAMCEFVAESPEDVRPAIEEIAMAHRGWIRSEQAS